VLEAKKLKAKPIVGAGETATRSFDDSLLRARSQAENYARALPAGEGRPPFVIVVDVGNVIELYAEFSQSGGTYLPFPDPRSHRIRLADLRDEAVRARVTREIAGHLAALAKLLEEAGHAPEPKATSAGCAPNSRTRKRHKPPSGWSREARGGGIKNLTQPRASRLQPALRPHRLRNSNGRPRSPTSSRRWQESSPTHPPPRPKPSSPPISPARAAGNPACPTSSPPSKPSAAPAASKTGGGWGRGELGYTFNC
jgi:cell division septation protein DedD